MTINHIDQLAEWWENAEKGAPNKGDTIIRQTERLLSNGYAYEVGTEDYTDARHLDNVRILARAPKPKPAWHDAPAIIATWYDPTEDETITGVWTHDAGVWKHEEGICVDADALTDVTPLIEAKVTREMVERARAECMKWEFGGISKNATRAILTAALGIEAE